MTIYLFIKTKNYHSLKKFSKILILNFFKHNITKVKYYPLSKKQTLFSILKSPHVNKIAQDQFKFKYSHRKIVITTKYFLKTMLIINKYFSNMFYDIKTKILFSTVQGNFHYKKKKNVCIRHKG